GIQFRIQWIGTLPPYASLRVFPFGGAGLERIERGVLGTPETGCALVAAPGNLRPGGERRHRRRTLSLPVERQHERLGARGRLRRSEEHTSELQSRENLV